MTVTRQDLLDLGLSQGPHFDAALAEANRLGIVLDASHASDAVFDQLLEVSRAPIVLSHTSADAVFDHPRNIDDDRIRRLAKKGGVIHVNAFGGYLISIPKVPEREAALDAAIDLASHKPDFCVIFQREQEVAKLVEGRDVAWHSFQYGVEPAECVPVEGNHPAYILYTSGTSGLPKGCLLSNEYVLTGGHWYCDAGGPLTLRESGELCRVPVAGDQAPGKR